MCCLILKDDILLSTFALFAISKNENIKRIELRGKKKTLFLLCKLVVKKTNYVVY